MGRWYPTLLKKRHRERRLLSPGVHRATRTARARPTHPPARLPRSPRVQRPPRSRVVPGFSEPEPPTDQCPECATECPDQVEEFPARRRLRISWAQLLKRVFGIDALACPACESGRLKLISFIAEPDTAGFRRNRPEQSCREPQWDAECRRPGFQSRIRETRSAPSRACPKARTRFEWPIRSGRAGLSPRNSEQIVKPTVLKQFGVPGK